MDLQVFFMILLGKFIVFNTKNPKLGLYYGNMIQRITTRRNWSSVKVQQLLVTMKTKVCNELSRFSQVKKTTL